MRMHRSFDYRSGYMMQRRGLEPEHICIDVPSFIKGLCIAEVRLMELFGA